MTNDLMRKEFERTSVRDTRRQPPKGNNYIDPMAQMDWLAFQKGWVQSRAALVIELPEPQLFEVSAEESLDMEPEEFERLEARHGAQYSAYRKCRNAIEAAGVKVRP